MSLLVPVITTIEADDDNNAGSSFVHHIATPLSVSRSLAVTIDPPAEDNENNVQQLLSHSSRSQLSLASPALGEPPSTCPFRRIARLFLCSIPRLSFYDSESPVTPHIHTALISTSHTSFYEHRNATKLHKNNQDIHSGKGLFQLLSPHDGHHMWFQMYYT